MALCPVPFYQCERELLVLTTAVLDLLHGVGRTSSGRQFHVRSNTGLDRGVNITCEIIMEQWYVPILLQLGSYR